MLAHDPLKGHRLSLERILDASHTIDPVFLNTPQYRAEALEPELGFELIVKVETLNPIRSFKGRGADYFVGSLEPGTQIVCASAGNWGQAIAYACRKRDLKLICYAATGANTLKLERIRALGAEVRLFGEDFDAAKLEAKRFARMSGIRMVEDGLDERISEGAGTIGLELCSYPEPLDAVLIPLGNGAMLGGAARAIKSLGPKTEVIAVCAEGATSMLESWRSNRVIEHERIDTIADGIGVRLPILEAVQDMQGLVDDALTVSDAQMLKAMHRALEGLGVTAHDLTGGQAGILTNNAFGNARPLPATYERVPQRLNCLFEQGITPVVTGFIGETESGAITTLGRGGSDYTATIIGAAKRARSAHRATVASNIVASEASGRNCLGRSGCDIGHSRVPEPPDRITGTMRLS